MDQFCAFIVSTSVFVAFVGTICFLAVVVAKVFEYLNNR